MRSSRHGRVLAALWSAFVAVCTYACASQNALEEAELTEGCVLNSDCTPPYICAFQTCHKACNDSADCTSPPGSHCVASGQTSEAGASSINVCEPPILCSYNTQCPGEQVCAPDGECRDQCRTVKDCVQGQLCVDRVCADPADVNSEGGLIEPDAGQASVGAPCSYNSDCPPGLFCRTNVCEYECKANVDCDAGEVCVAHQCRTPSLLDGASPDARRADGGKPSDGGRADGAAHGDAARDGTMPADAGRDTGGHDATGHDATRTGEAGRDANGHEAGLAEGGGGDGAACVPKSCSTQGFDCGTALDGCGRALICGTGDNQGCGAGQTCGGGGHNNECGSSTCTPSSCSSLNATCGPVNDGCGGVLMCGGCPVGTTCGGGGTPNQCGCTVTASCESLGVNCGKLPDGCGGTLDCGSCSGGETCGANGTPNVCGTGSCVPATCGSLGANCGSVATGCGEVTTCGACDAGTCGGGGEPNQCGCTPLTCDTAGANCGTLSDGCGGSLDCGVCASPQSCGGGGAAYVCGCAPIACPTGACGTMSDGCGRYIDCGSSCGGGQICGGAGVPNECGTPSTGTSCAGSAITCGTDGSDNCCASDVVPTGVYNRQNGNDAGDQYPAKVSQFILDRYEVTVSRFRAFLNAPNSLAYSVSPPVAGAGADPNINAAEFPTGWNAAWSRQLPASLGDYEEQFATSCSNPTFLSADASSDPYEGYPINCINWYEAFAFCIWDGGRLPTENEWLEAAIGGTDYRPYPWSTSPTDLTAVNCVDDNISGCGPSEVSQLIAAGSNGSSGDALWGARNMNGNVSEWLLDNFYNGPGPYLYTNCSEADCADTVSDSGDQVVYYLDDSENHQGTTQQQRASYSPTKMLPYLGVRCARN